MHDDAMEPASGKRSKSRGNMFLVDIPTYAAVCSLGDPDAAAVYLILAAGTGHDNRTSTWSREAVNKRTGLNWRKADAAIRKLEEHGFARWLDGKGTRKPRIELPPIETRAKMQKHVAALADRIMHGEQPTTPTDKGTATVGRDAGWLAQGEDGTWQFIADRPMVKAYLPNSLVGDETGKATGTSTIVDRIRLARDPMAFRLLVDLYALQDLAEHGGVDRYFLSKRCNRETKFRTGTFQIWHFGPGTAGVRDLAEALRHHSHRPSPEEKAAGKNSAMKFYPRLAILEDAGALEWVYYLAEDGSDEATRIYPVAVERHGKVVWSELETIVGGYAIRAACALSDDQSAKAWEEFMPNGYLLPAERVAREVALVGVPRLRHRAKTTNAARWRKELVEESASVIAMFRGIIAEHQPELLVEADRRLADFNVEFNEASTETSTLVQRDINDPSWSGKHEGSVLRTDAGDPASNVFGDQADDNDPFAALWSRSNTGGTRP